VRVGIKWSQRKAVLGRGVMTGQLQLLRLNDVVRVSDEPPTLLISTGKWAKGQSLLGICAPVSNITS